ncbi:MAG: TerC family protein [bacterium]|nr:TerC family protein [bacterium]
MIHPVIGWSVFGVFIVAMMTLDLGVFRRRSHDIGMREALGWSAAWIGLALAFNLGVGLVQGRAAGLEFLAGYLIELSLSVDNLFVFLVIFTYFRIPGAYRHQVLFWGILGALIMRGIFIFAGVVLINRFEWVLYVFGAFLIYTGIKMAFQKETEVHPEKSTALRLFRRVVPVTDRFEGGRFFTRVDGRRLATPLLVALVFIEISDLLFAVDSIPAIFGVTRNPFIVYTSNIFAILGLRSMYFALARLMQLFHYLHYGLAAVLCFVGFKMLLGYFDREIPVGVALAVIATVLGVCIIVSIRWPKKRTAAALEESAIDGGVAADAGAGSQNPDCQD